MISHISRILEAFRPCFARQAAYHWFAVVVLGFMVRIDQCGVSSFIRWLGIEPSLYTALLSFFRAKSWQLSTIMHRWWKIVLERFADNHRRPPGVGWRWNQDLQGG